MCFSIDVIIWLQLHYVHKYNTRTSTISNKNQLSRSDIWFEPVQGRRPLYLFYSPPTTAPRLLFLIGYLLNPFSVQVYLLIALFRKLYATSVFVPFYLYLNPAYTYAGVSFRGFFRAENQYTHVPLWTETDTYLVYFLFRISILYEYYNPEYFIPLYPCFHAWMQKIEGRMRNSAAWAYCTRLSYKNDDINNPKIYLRPFTAFYITAPRF